MQLRAQAIVFWPGMTNDISERRNQCLQCNRNAPTQSAIPSEPCDPPSSPFEQIFADFFDFGGHHYLVAGDRLSGFAEIFQTPSGSSSAGAQGLVKCLRKWFATFGVPRQLSSDGGPEFLSGHTAEFFKLWGVTHRVSSAYNPQSKGRAEVAVKSVKRLMRSNLGPFGSLDTDRFLRGMLQLRNTPDPDCGVSPSEIVFGRLLRDNLLFADYLNREQYSKRWQDAWSAKEEALRARFIRTSENMNRHARYMQPLSVGDKCFVQNQAGQHAKKWHHTGTVMEVLPHDKYGIRMDGSGRVTYRNRRFLKRYTPASLTVPHQYPIHTSPPAYPSIVPEVVSNLGPGLRRPEVPEPPQQHVICCPPAGITAPDVAETPVMEEEPSVSCSSPVIRAPSRRPSASHSSPVIQPRPRSRLPPLALRQLADYNAPGLKESSVG